MNRDEIFKAWAADVNNIRETVYQPNIENKEETIHQQDSDIDELLLIIAGGENDGTL